MPFNEIGRNVCLREAFRLSKVELNELETKFDWVLNARRLLLRVKARTTFK